MNHERKRILTFETLSTLPEGSEEFFFFLSITPLRKEVRCVAMRVHSCSSDVPRLCLVFRNQRSSLSVLVIDHHSIDWHLAIPCDLTAQPRHYKLHNNSRCRRSCPQVHLSLISVGLKPSSQPAFTHSLARMTDVLARASVRVTSPPYGTLQHDC